MHRNNENRCRREPREPMRYHNADLIAELNEFCIALKLWLYPEECGDRVAHLQVAHPKPSGREIDLLQAKINTELEKDCEPMRKY